MAGAEYKKAYLLANTIYHEFTTFIHTITSPSNEKHEPRHEHYTKVLEAVRKDVERCFEVLKSKFVAFNNPTRLWSQSKC